MNDWLTFSKLKNYRIESKLYPNESKMAVEQIVSNVESFRFFMNYVIVPLLAMILYWLYKSQRSKQSKDGLLPLPPCLPSLPIVGSLPFIPNFEKIFLTFMDLRSKYGDIFAFYAGSRYTVVLNGLEMVREVVVKRGQFTSDRESPVLDRDYVNPDALGIIFSSYAEQYRTDRMTSMSILKDFGFGKEPIMGPRIQAESLELIQSINKLNGQAFNPAELMRFTTQNVICRLMLDERFEQDDEEGKVISDFIASFVEASPAAMLIFSVLKYLPSYSKRLSHAEFLYRKFRSLMVKKIERSRESDSSDFCKEYRSRRGDKYNEENLHLILRDLLAAGTDTTSIQMCWVLIFIANYPEVKEKLQQEMDSVVPRDRLPDFGDRAKLPYFNAVLLEIMRIKILLPVMPPRLITEDLELTNFRVPAGSMVVVNLWSLHMDPAIWPKPEEFKPERFLGKDNEIINRDMIYSFSIGRRSCVGESLARMELFLITAALIQKFDILPPEGQDKVTYKENNEILRRAEDYKLRLVPRINAV